jgi:hypothetical protein
MDSKQVHVHDEEALIESILSGAADPLPPGQDDCPECAAIVKDVRKLKNGLASIEDEEPPQLHMEEILQRRTKPLLTPWIQDLPGDWYRNPFVMSFGFLMFVLIIYFLTVFVFR